MNFSEFQHWREQRLRDNPEALDCGETNLYRALAHLQPKPDAAIPSRHIHRCNLARAWLNRYQLPESSSRLALVSRGVRHSLGMIFRELAADGSILWIPSDVYPVYFQLAHEAGIEPRLFHTLPQPLIPQATAGVRPEYLLIANPLKPLGRYLTDLECATLGDWLGDSANRFLLLDCVYDLRRPFHPTTQRLLATGRAILLHSVTKGWLWPKTFGVTLISENNRQWEPAFRGDPPAPEHLDLAEQLLSVHSNLPSTLIMDLGKRKQQLTEILPADVSRMMLCESASQADGCYLFPIGIQATKLFEQHRIIAMPASAFGAKWDGCILTSLAASFAGKTTGRLR